eukprot:TRINITY_DN20078_c0_g2_i1.p1 TRINITY_DN20078_c0_g2~~TRINITY_DN20078_c0_g2_i1.p1  ORF type:complete len:933 (+),score=117.80 TRINITY_DN20078_c0_g2_i1:61-2859(+)
MVSVCSCTDAVSGDLARAGDVEIKGESSQVDAESALLSIIRFLAKRVSMPRMHLAHRFIEALWGRAPCLHHWATMADLLLLGEGGCAAGGLRPLPALGRTALLYIMEASLRCAMHPDEDVDISNAAVGALLPRLPKILDICGSDEAAAVPIAAVAKMLIERAVYNLGQVQGEKAEFQAGASLPCPPRALVVALRRAAALDLQPRTMSLLADALFALARRSSEALSEAVSLACDLRGRCEEMMRRCCHAASPGLATTEELASNLGRLLVLCNRGIDVSCVGLGDCEEPRYVLVESAFFLLKRCMRRSGVDGCKDENGQDALELSVQLLVQLLEFVFLFIAWRLRAVGSVGDARANASVGDGAAASDPMVAPPLAALTAQQLNYVRVTALDHKKLPSAIKQLRDISAVISRDNTSGAVCLQAMSVYMGSVQLMMSTSGIVGSLPRNFRRRDDASTCQLWPCSLLHISKEHIACLETCLSRFIKKADVMLARSTVSGALARDTVTSVGQRVEVNLDHSVPLTSIRRLLEPGCLTEEGSGPEEVAAAVAACRIVAECEHEDIYSSVLGRVVLLQATRDRAPVPLRDVAFEFAARLRRLGTITRLDAARYFAVMLAAAGVATLAEGRGAGVRLIDRLHMGLAPPISSSPETTRLGAGLSDALRAHVSEAHAGRSRLCTEAVIALIRHPATSLSASASRALMCDFVSKSNGSASLRSLVLALQTSANQLRRGASWRVRIMRAARLRLKRRPCQAAEVSATSGWITKRTTGGNATSDATRPGAGSNLPHGGLVTPPASPQAEGASRIRSRPAVDAVGCDSKLTARSKASRGKDPPPCEGNRSTNRRGKRSAAAALSVGASDAASSKMPRVSRSDGGEVGRHAGRREERQSARAPSEVGERTDTRPALRRSHVMNSTAQPESVQVEQPRRQWKLKAVSFE